MGFNGKLHPPISPSTTNWRDKLDSGSENELGRKSIYLVFAILMSLDECDFREIQSNGAIHAAASGGSEMPSEPRTEMRDIELVITRLVAIRMSHGRKLCSWLHPR